jgi:hypothetical protein
MKNLFFSPSYINTAIDSAKQLLSNNVDSFLVTDSTYAHDNRASVQIHVDGITFLMFLPNSLNNNAQNEEYNFFTLILDSDYASDVCSLNENFYSMKDAIDMITFEYVLA